MEVQITNIFTIPMLALIHLQTLIKQLNKVIHTMKPYKSFLKDHQKIIHQF